MEIASKQNHNTLCRWLSVFIGIVLIASGTLVEEAVAALAREST